MEAGVAKRAARVDAEAKIARAREGAAATLKGADAAKGRQRVTPLAKPTRQAAQRVGPHHERPIPWVGRKPKAAL